MANIFSTIATLPAGFSGPSPAIDLFAVAAPSGFDAETLTLACVGLFEGVLAVESSPDGTNWSSLAEFGGSDDVVSPVVLPAAYSPADPRAVARYVRVNLRGGLVVEATTLTVGGSPECDCSESGGGGISISDQVEHELKNDTSGEVIVGEWVEDFDVLGATFEAHWGFEASYDGAEENGLVTLRIGATNPGSIAGSTSILQSIVNTGGSFVKTLETALGLANPTGAVIVQVTIQNGESPATGAIRAQGIVFK